MKTNITDAAITSTLAGLQAHYGKKYCIPSQAKILELLKSRHKIQISRRTLNRRLKNIEGGGYIKRIRRHRRTDDGRFEMRTTAYYILKKTSNLLKKLAKIGKSLYRRCRMPDMAQYTINKTIVFNKIATYPQVGCG